MEPGNSPTLLGKAGLIDIGTGYGMGAAVGDYDNDGFTTSYISQTTVATFSIAIEEMELSRT